MKPATLTVRISLALGMVFILAAFQPIPKYPGYKPIDNLAGFKSRFAETALALHSFKGEFRQEKTLLALTEKITSKGTLWFKRDNKVRMSYTTPFLYEMVINGDKMTIKENDKQTRINAASHKLLQQVNRIMIDCMQGTILESKDFTTTAYENDATYLLELNTQSKNLKPFISSIVLIVDKKDHSPNSIELNEPSGDKTVILLKNKIINGQMTDEVFSF
jgi:outer membrane lipoprotein-sorting protein